MGNLLLTMSVFGVFGFLTKSWLAPGLLAAGFIVWNFTVGWSYDENEIGFGLLLAVEIAAICIVASGVALGRSWPPSKH